MFSPLKRFYVFSNGTGKKFFQKNYSFEYVLYILWDPPDILWDPFGYIFLGDIRRMLTAYLASLNILITKERIYYFF
jgi:hypothetical protein